MCRIYVQLHMHSSIMHSIDVKRKDADGKHMILTVYVCVKLGLIDSNVRLNVHIG
jgi:hypothetical protein